MLIGSEKPEEPGPATPLPSPVDHTEPDLQVGDGPESPPSTPSQGARWSRLLAAVAGLLLVLLIIATVVLFSDRSKVNHLDAVASAQSTALATARSDSLAIASYDYRNLNAEFAHVETLCTPSFAVTYAQSSKSLITLLSQFHATATANVLAAGAVSVSTSRAVVLVFVDQTITNDKYKTSTDDQRLEMTLLHEHGRWLIDNLILP